jgi:hypothetical protein
MRSWKNKKKITKTKVKTQFSANEWNSLKVMKAIIYIEHLLDAKNFA